MPNMRIVSTISLTILTD